MVEVGQVHHLMALATRPGIVLVRDTKNRDTATLAFTPAAWASFVGLAKQHRTHA
ncbi:DUF397 domain-containing protein [Micromonospora sp. C51]|uniref:DUF397 domain-containing protein n=1 Tax=Micromonospora sp. C51 TaxID=2824879 RepID=UPI0027DE4E8E|nr:DUF397 domain-containing protein [Micromonospora sp. C51]